MNEVRRYAEMKLRESAANPVPGEWREGHDAALQLLLLEVFGVQATFQPATYSFDEPPKTKTKEV